MAGYPELPDVHVLLEDQESGERGLTNGGCSGNDGLPPGRDAAEGEPSGEDHSGPEDGLLADRFCSEYRQLAEEPPYLVVPVWVAGEGAAGNIAVE